MSDQEKTARQAIAALTLAISVRSIPRMLSPLLEMKLTIQQLKVLTRIVVDDGGTVSALAAACDTSLAAASKLADRLAAQGLVTRVADDQDHRVKRVVPTSAGRDVVRQLVAARPELGDDILDGLSLDELQALVTALRAISREMKAATISVD